MKQEQSSLEKGTEVFCKQIQQLHFKSIESFEIGCNVAIADQKVKMITIVKNKKNILQQKSYGRKILLDLLKEFEEV